MMMVAVVGVVLALVVLVGSVGSGYLRARLALAESSGVGAVSRVSGQSLVVVADQGIVLAAVVLVDRVGSGYLWGGCHVDGRAL